MKQELLSYLLGEMTISFLIAFYIFAIVGSILSMLLHLGKVVKKHKIKPSFGYWLHDNGKRLLTSIIVLFIAARFYQEIEFMQGYELNMFSGFAAGMSIDRIIILIRNKTKLNTFQK